MKKYFIDKLTEIKSSIDGTKRQIVESVQTLSELRSLNSIVEVGKKLQAFSEEFKEMQTDCMKYCSVTEVIEIASQKSYYGDTTLNLIDYDNVVYYYKYSSNGITINERDLLAKHFSRSLSEVKIK